MNLQPVNIYWSVSTFTVTNRKHDVQGHTICLLYIIHYIYILLWLNRRRDQLSLCQSGSWKFPPSDASSLLAFLSSHAILNLHCHHVPHPVHVGLIPLHTMKLHFHLSGTVFAGFGGCFVIYFYVGNVRDVGTVGIRKWCSILRRVDRLLYVFVLCQPVNIYWSVSTVTVTNRKHDVQGHTICLLYIIQPTMLCRPTTGYNTSPTIYT